MRRRELRCRSFSRCSAVAVSRLRLDRCLSFSLSSADRSAVGASSVRGRAVVTIASLVGGVQTDTAVSPSRLPGLLATIVALSSGAIGGGKVRISLLQSGRD